MHSNNALLQTPPQPPSVSVKPHPLITCYASQAITDTIELSDGEHDTSAKHSVVSKGKMKAVEIDEDDIIDLLSDHEEDRKAAQQRRSFANSKLVEEYAAKTLFWYDDTEVEEADDGNEYWDDTDREIDLWGGSEATAHIPLTDR